MGRKIIEYIILITYQRYNDQIPRSIDSRLYFSQYHHSFSSKVLIPLSSITFLYLIYIFKFNFALLVSKNFVYFACQFLTNFAKINNNASLAIGLNWLNTSFKIHRY